MTPMPESMDTVRVPRVPTEVDVEAVGLALKQHWLANSGAPASEYFESMARAAWSAMLSAAPTPPAVSGVREALVERLNELVLDLRKIGWHSDIRTVQEAIAALASLAPESGSAGK
jgi:hypothetical protein